MSYISGMNRVFSDEEAELVYEAVVGELATRTSPSHMNEYWESARDHLRDGATLTPDDYGVIFDALRRVADTSTDLRKAQRAKATLAAFDLQDGR